VWFAYSPNRKGEHPQQHLAKFEGILQADAFAGFNKLYESGTIQQAPCMAHIRRNFFDLMKAHNSPIATEAVQRIAALYLIEKQIKGRPADQRRAILTLPSECVSLSRLVLGDVVIPVAVVAVGMWESA
jgi:hypothetical protein